MKNRKTRPGTDCGSDHELLIVKDNLKLKKVEKITTPFSESESRSVVSDSLQPHGLYSPWNSPGQNTGVGSLSLLQGIFSTQGSNPGLPHCRQILYQLSRRGGPASEGKGCYFVERRRKLGRDVLNVQRKVRAQGDESFSSVELLG